MLAVTVVADAITLLVAVRPLRASPMVERIGLRRGLRYTSDAASRTLIFDNTAAMFGSIIAIAGLAVHQATGNGRADAAASLAIGVLLILTTGLLLRANRELLTDRAISPTVLGEMRERVLALDGVEAVPDLLAVYTGPRAVLVAGTVVMADDFDVPGVERALAQSGESLAERWPGELRVYLSPVPHPDGTGPGSAAAEPEQRPLRQRGVADDDGQGPVDA